MEGSAVLTMVVSRACIKKPKATIHNCQRTEGGSGVEGGKVSVFSDFMSHRISTIIVAAFQEEIHLQTGSQCSQNVSTENGGNKESLSHFLTILLTIKNSVQPDILYQNAKVDL
jgi:hypothetical protein